MTKGGGLPPTHAEKIEKSWVKNVPTVVWRPNAGSQQRFLTCPTFEALLHGTRGGGKTDALLMSFAQFVGRGYGVHWNGVLFRLTYPQLADVVRKSKRWFRSIFPNAVYNKAEHKWEFESGESLAFRYGDGEDDYWSYHGHEYPWLGFEELTSWRNSDFYEAMLTTCRSSVAGMPRMVRATTNPFGRGHLWVKQRYALGVASKDCVILNDADGRQRVAIRSSLDENLHLLAADPLYIKTLEGIKDVNRRRAWLDGSWDIHFGSFLDGVWDAAKAVVAPFSIPASWEVWRSMDWGYAAPYAIYWWAKNPDGVCFIWRELYGAGEREGDGTKEPASVVAERMKTIEQHDARYGYEYRVNLADPAIFQNHGGQYGTSQTIARIFLEHGVRWHPAWNAPGSRRNGAQAIIQALSEGKLKVFSTCTHWLRTVPSLPPSDRDPDDVNTDVEDHAWDAMRYGFVRRRAAPDAPVKAEVRTPQWEGGVHRLPLEVGS